jgi:hypothetical protein
VKVHVITDAAGEVLGTARLDLSPEPGAPRLVGLQPEEGQQAHEIEISDEFESMSIEEFHKKVGEHVRKSR